MTQEQKAKAYDEAFNRAKSWYTDAQIDFKKSLETLFPELKCDDEKIRKEIIKCVKNYGPSSANPQLFKNMLAWLEKQEGCECIKKDWLEHIKQSWYKEGFIDGKYSGGTSKEWTINDAATLKELIDFLENGTAKLQHDLTKYANWLKIQFTPIEKQGKQFSVDKLKPKFHEGEWITNGDYTWKVIKVEQFDYILQSQNDNVVDDTISHVDEQFHLWTIKDAKVGDVLSSDNSIFIFQEEYIAKKPIAYCGLMNGRFIEGKDACWTNEKYYPATKEQRDTLEKAMADAGYTFDFEKKELRKIKQKSAEWSEEDEHRVEDIIYFLDTAKKHYASTVELDASIDWLKSLKQRIGG